jgi:hypothetical protein
MADTDTPVDDEQVDDTDVPTDLGDAGKKALQQERDARREAEKRLKEFEDRDKSELEKLQEQVQEREAQLSELPAKARSEAIRFASAATRAGFLDPEDALLNLRDVDLSDGEAVTAALSELAERKPHLVREPAKATPPTRPKPTAGHKAGDEEQADSKQRAANALRALRTQ